jgi:hypothetical protein
LIAFAPEKQPTGEHELFVVHNTMVNDRSDGRFVWNNSNGLAYVYNNLFVGPGKPIRGEALAVGNVVVAGPEGISGAQSDPFARAADGGQNKIAADAGFVDREGFDYRLRQDSPAVDAGHALESIGGHVLPPEHEPSFLRYSKRRPISGPPDVGAFELGVRN